MGTANPLQDPDPRQDAETSRGQDKFAKAHFGQNVGAMKQCPDRNPHAHADGDKLRDPRKRKRP